MRRRQGNKGNRLGHEERRELARLVADGATHAEAAVRLSCSAKTVQRLLATSGGMPLRNRPRAALRLSPEDREEISRGLKARLSFRCIADRIGRAPSTVSREVGVNGGRRRYRAWLADQRAGRRSERPKPCKLGLSLRLRNEVSRRLAQCWSREQISRRLLTEYPDDSTMRVSHETIYRSLYVQGRGALRKELHACLRTGRAQRRPRGRTRSVTKGRIREMVMISERPPEVEDRAVPGHWEGDLILGRKGQSAIATLVERKTRFVMLVALGGKRTAEHVSTLLSTHIQTLPEQLRRSLTWDQGKEMADHRRFTVETGVPVYFCDPYSPWQRGSNENTNGLLRQYLPRSKDLDQYDQAHLDTVAAELNSRPRQTLGWMTPSEKIETVLR